jgi:predicted O-methyltransferase YrrM
MGQQYQLIDLGDQPCVSCIMPTYGRPKLVPESVAMFLAQDYRNKELIILNDCPGQEFVASLPGVLVINDPARHPTLGEKRNAAIEAARGSLIAVWDDDDVYLPWRLSYCVKRMQELRTPFLLPHEYWAYWGEEVLHHNQAVPGWIGHPLAIFRKDLWQQAGGYPNITLGEDASFFQRVFSLLGVEWISQPIAMRDRFFILRGKSEYHHTSIGGGQLPLDTSQGRFHLAPQPIADAVLRSAAKRLIQQRTEQLGGEWPATPATESAADVEHLDDWEPSHVRLGYGQLGRHGALGYENKRVEVAGREFGHALSAHGSSELHFMLSGKFTSFFSEVALNDDVPRGQSAADFCVFADGELVGLAQHVCPGQVRRTISADIHGAEELRLVVQARRWDYCHSVWLDPRVTCAPAESGGEFVDCLRRARIFPSAATSRAEVCIATVGSPGFEPWIDNLLGSIRANAQCLQVEFAIFFFNVNREAERIARRHNAALVPCEPLASLNPASKSVLYSAGRILPARKLLCLDADMIVLDDLRPVIAAIDSLPLGSVLACREAAWAADLSGALQSIYGGDGRDIDYVLNGKEQDEGRSSLVINDGFFAGSRAALCSVDETIRNMPQAIRWVDARPDIPWRNQFVFNLALTHLHCGVPLDERFNVQLNCRHVEFTERHRVPAASSIGSKSSVVHFNGSGRARHPEIRHRYQNVTLLPHDPREPGDSYREFTDALRIWIGNVGTEQLTWSFYGTSDGCSARVKDPSSFPLLATLHALIRSNGCTRVIETGTARGVSAACLASAVVHRDAPTVVSLDPAVFPEREELWGLLPKAMRDCIRPRQTDAIAGLSQALDRGEEYHAALLDSVHTCQHVLGEFELARQLVCPGGLILIHDPLLPTGTVGEALDQISAQGYGVVRLWSADKGEQEDDRLGLAIVENRCRSVRS